MNFIAVGIDCRKITVSTVPGTRFSVMLAITPTISDIVRIITFAGGIVIIEVYASASIPSAFFCVGFGIAIIIISIQAS